MKDNSGHGSHVANSIANSVHSSNLCFIIIKAFDPLTPKYFKNHTSRTEFEYLTTILKAGDIVNYSAGGEGNSDEEKQAIKELLQRGVKIFVAAGNEGKNLDKTCNYYPACYHLNGLNVIGNIYKNGYIVETSNYNGPTTEYENGVNVISDNGTGMEIAMTGTSQATAKATGKYIRSLK